MGGDLLKVMHVIQTTVGPELGPFNPCSRTSYDGPTQPSALTSRGQAKACIDNKEDSVNLPCSPGRLLHLAEPQFLQLYNRDKNTLPRTRTI